MTPADFDLSPDDLRIVTEYVAAAAEALLPFYAEVHPGDTRPRDAIAAAWLFVGGAPRSALQRTTSMEAHRAAAGATDAVARLAAQAAGDAASAAYLHPIAKAHQVGHILRADANAARIAEITAVSGPVAAHDAIARAAGRATPELRGILRRYPPAAAGRSRTAQLMKILDDALRTTP
ncbi:putative immunity protein [Mycolicibacterium frederiksbergense]|uniref:Exonuclease SbcC n=1 Tax=Mycolicibacterium frederiksbergense TaxID=117567 RepID=A0A6H0S392_9MYCO|nr:exonuclease SbcC [Mycolicibacterium frederiksbergense]QIV80507.1 exonuclease SbcC [Mycolicibacterium frederiksbergense]